MKEGRRKSDPSLALFCYSASSGVADLLVSPLKMEGMPLLVGEKVILK